MADRFTSIQLRDVFGSGLAEHGRCEPSQMIAEIRKWALNNKQTADAILSAPDEDFHIATYVGVHVKRNKETIQKGRPRKREQ